MIVEDVDSWKAPDAKAIAAYLKSPAPETVLALVGVGAEEGLGAREGVREGGRRPPLRRAAKRDLPEWVAEQFERHGAQRRPSTRAACSSSSSERIPSELRERDREARDLGGRRARERSATSDCSRRARAETSVLRPHRRVGPARRRAQRLAAAEALLERSRDAAGACRALVGLLASHVGRVRACQALAAEGVRAREAASRLKRHPFYVEKLTRRPRNFTAGRARARGRPPRRARPARSRAAAALAGELELERALVDDHARGTRAPLDGAAR